MKSKVYTVLKENMMLKDELQRLLSLVKENEAKHKGFRLVEDAFLTAETLEDVDKKALAYMEEIFEIDRAVLFLDREAFRFDKLPQESAGRIIYTDEKTLKYAYVEKRPYFGTYMEGLISDFHIMGEIGSYLIAPLVENGNIVGSLNLYSTSPAKLSGEAHADFIKELMLRVRITLRKMHNTYTILSQAQYDYLTGVYNKSMMEQLVERYIDRYTTTGEGFTFVLTDMDNFKMLNDTQGHLEGDSLLRKVADEIRKMLPQPEEIGRFGGDEFYIILNTVSPEVVDGQFEKISNVVKIEAKKYNLDGVVTISAGYVRVPEDLNNERFNVVDIVKLADLGLYHSKALGKRVCSAYSDVRVKLDTLKPEKQNSAQVD